MRQGYSFTQVIRGGRKGTGKPRTVYVHVPARLLVPVDRFNSGMTVGGSYHHYSHTDPIGASVEVIGFFSDGTANVLLHGGGCGLLSMADIEITEWPAEVSAELKDLYEQTAPHVHDFTEPKPEVFKVSRKQGAHSYCEGCGRWQYRKVAA
jgi:hypothetical protein